jgi:hypothetical protein
MDDPGAVATHYRLDRTQPALIGGLRAYPASDRRDPARRLLGIQVPPGVAPRARLLTGQFALPVAHTIMPIDHGPGRDPAGAEAWFIICPALPGPALTAAPAPWAENDLINNLMLPAAAALDVLAERGVTHRAIRPDNVFRAGPGEKAVLGPFWAAPPGHLQQAACLPPYLAMCAPGAAGEAAIADDVYALGVTMLWCALGGAVAWPDAPRMVPLKLNLGSLATLAGEARLSTTLTDLLRLMLADDPDHRPPPASLLDPAQARSRRLATRPPQRAQRPLQIGQNEAWTTRELTYAIARDPERAVPMIKTGAIDRWLRRMLNDTQAAIRLEDVTHTHAEEIETESARTDALLIMRAVAVLDPLAPLVWRGVALFPDAVGTALAAAHAAGESGRAIAAAIEELVAGDAVSLWPGCTTRRRDPEALKAASRDWRNLLATRGQAGGIKRLIYSLNPLLPCASPLLAGHIAARPTDILPALEAAAAGADRKHPPMDSHIAAFIAATGDSPLLAELGSIENMAGPRERMAVLGFFGRLQMRLHPAPLPGLAGWLLECGLIDLTSWQSLLTRKALAERLAAEAKAGQIAAMVLLLRNDTALATDRAGAEQAAQRMAAINAELSALRDGGKHRAAACRRTGHEIAASLGLIASMCAALVLALSL